MINSDRMWETYQREVLGVNDELSKSEPVLSKGIIDICGDHHFIISESVEGASN